jgi:uncharacterized membrane protein
MPKAKDFFTVAESEQIVQAIRDAEKATSGEIRVHLEEKCKGDALNRAIALFDILKMDVTELHNGVIIYLAVEDKKFAIYGGKGINEKVPANFWQQTRDVMQAHFKEGRFAQGLSESILQAGQQLKTYFPYQKEDANELDDNISYHHD